MVNLNKLEELMTRKGWGAGELAEYSGVSYDTIYSLRKGRRPNTSSRTLQKLAAALNTSANELLEESCSEDDPSTRKLPEPVGQLAEIARNLSEMRQEELRQIATLLDRLDRERRREGKMDEAEKLLDSIERTMGRKVRDEVEKMIRSIGVSINPAP